MWFTEFSSNFVVSGVNRQITDRKRTVEEIAVDLSSSDDLKQQQQPFRVIIINN